MSPAAQMVEEAAKRGLQIARLLNTPKGGWHTAFKNDDGDMFTGTGDTLEAALRAALDSAPTLEA